MFVVIIVGQCVLDFRLSPMKMEPIEGSVFLILDFRL